MLDDAPVTDAAPPGGDLRVSAARCDITPMAGVRLVGYLDRDVPAERVNDPLTATAVALRDPVGDALVIVCCDVLGFPLELSRRIRRGIGDVCGLPEESVWLAPSHTHSGPPTHPGSYGTQVELDWLEQLPLSLVAVASEAWTTLRPARMRLATGTSAIGVNRRVLGADDRVSEMGEADQRPVDDRVLALQFEALDGAPIACLVNVACHPVVCGRDTRYVSADYPGALRAALEATGCGLCAFTLGACGDVNPAGGIHADPRHAEEVGRKVAGDLLAALEHATVEPSTPLRVARTSVKVAYPAVGDVHFEHLTEAGGLSPAVLGELIERRFPWVSPVDRTGAVDVELVAGRVGAILFAAVPYEVFAETGRRLREQLGLQVATVALANSVIGYLPPADELPRGGYEVDESFLFFRLPGPPVSSAEASIVDGVAELAARLAGA
jgi:neutral ceramidase